MKKYLVSLCFAIALTVTALARYVTIPEQNDIRSNFHGFGNIYYGQAVNAPTLEEAQFWFGAADAAWDSELVCLQIDTEVMAWCCEQCVDLSLNNRDNATTVMDYNYWAGAAVGYNTARAFVVGY